jgi:hypothetical protein
MSSLYFGLSVSCQFDTKVPEFDEVFSVHCTVYTARGGGGGCVAKSGPLVSNKQKTASPKYNDDIDISLLISQYLISVPE